MDTDLLNYPLCVTVLLKKTARVPDTITRESDGLVPLSPWSWTCLPFTQGRRRSDDGQLLNECQTAGENPSWSWDEKPLSSCNKRILQIAQTPIADAENTARKTVPKTRFLGDSSRDQQPIACAIWGCLGAIILSHAAHPSEAGARPVSHDCRSACTEIVHKSDSMADA
jgi:hypothetical protein